ncbi:MAG: hypothetical protein PHX83_12250 [Acidobacteriia bacterium]|nr:hypothetical protein [Terriglobia bacterium]
MEIDCPITCPYLREGYDYGHNKSSAETPAPTSEVKRSFDHRFIVANEPFLLQQWQVIWETYQSLTQIHDSDILNALIALQKTYETLDKGLYYDSKPEQGLQQILYTKLKEAIDKAMSHPDAQKSHMKLSTVLDCLTFQRQLVEVQNAGRPLGRRFLLQLQDVFGRTTQAPQAGPGQITLA